MTVSDECGVAVGLSLHRALLRENGVRIVKVIWAHILSLFMHTMLKIIKERELLFAPDVTGLVHFLCASAATEVGLALIMP